MAEPDYTNKYNTKLSEENETEFQDWAKDNPRLGNTFDYDARGFWQAGGNTAANGHGSDTWKKPNHPTFSSGSMYDGADDQHGGVWQSNPDGSYNFFAGPTNQTHYTPDELNDYFANVEPGNNLFLTQDE